MTGTVSSMLLLALAAAASAAPLDVAAGGAAGIYAGLPGAGAELEAVAGADSVLQVRGSAGAFGRVRAWPTAFNAFYPMVATASLEAAIGRPVGQRSRVGPAIALDTLVFHAAEQDCSEACRFNVFLGGSAGPAMTGAIAAGGRWSRRAEHSLDLGFALQPSWSYDMGVIVPRLDLDWTRPDGWAVSAEVSRYEIALELGRSLGR